MTTFIVLVLIYLNGVPVHHQVIHTDSTVSCIVVATRLSTTEMTKPVKSRATHKEIIGERVAWCIGPQGFLYDPRAITS